MAAIKISTTGFLKEFQIRHSQMVDRPFCWILGAGASYQSGIPTGAALALQWLKELHSLFDLDERPIEEWATAENLNIKGFQFEAAASFYPAIYQRRFGDFKEQGYACLEAIMDGAEPSYGYSVLAQIMTSTQHKIAVTTNFDNLIADAIAIYTRAFPLVCGHESLTGFIRPNLSRPVVAKIHRDLLLNPKSEPEEIERLTAEWESALQIIFENNTPVVIGYGGNDGSLMGFLSKLPPVKGGIFWCYRIGHDPDDNIRRVVEHHKGKLVPILGFDEVMLQLWAQLALPSPIPELQETHDRRKINFQRQFEELNKRLGKPAESKAAEIELRSARKAAANATERLQAAGDPWSYKLRARGEKDVAKREQILREAVAAFPENVDVLNSLAWFLATELKNYAEAEDLARAGLKIDPEYSFLNDTLACILWKSGKSSEEADKLFQKALQLDPTSAIKHANYAQFLEETKRSLPEAERHYDLALKYDPDLAQAKSGYDKFLLRHPAFEPNPRFRRLRDRGISGLGL